MSINYNRNSKFTGSYTGAGAAHGSLRPSVADETRLGGSRTTAGGRKTDPSAAPWNKEPDTFDFCLARNRYLEHPKRTLGFIVAAMVSLAALLVLMVDQVFLPGRAWHETSLIAISVYSLGFSSFLVCMTGSHEIFQTTFFPSWIRMALILGYFAASLAAVGLSVALALIHG